MAEPKALEGRLTTPRIIFLVVAGAAPLVAMVGTVPISIGVGNGAGVPGMYLIASVTLALFAVGYAAMAQRITNAGGFYTYIVRGIGRPAAAGGAVLALVAYNALAVALVGGLGYFAETVFASDFDIHLPWELYSAVGVAIIAVLGYRKVDIGARLVGVLMLAELLVLTVLDVAIIVRQGLSAFPAASFTPSTVFSGAPGVAMMFAFGSFAGFEAAALYGEEARNPRRTIPRATFGALAVIAGFYIITSWMLIGGAGPEGAQAAAQQETGTYALGLSAHYVGSWSVHVLSFLIVTSLLASVLAAHNASSRYMFALGRERLLPHGLGVAHPVYGSPSRASLVQTSINVVIAGAFALAGLDPYLNLVTTMSGLSTIGILLLQALAAVAIIAYFRRSHEVGTFRAVIAPGLGLLGLLGACVLTLQNFRVLAGTEALAVNILPYLAIAAAIVAGIYAVWLRGARPETYAGLGALGGSENPGTDEALASSDAELGPTSPEVK